MNIQLTKNLPLELAETNYITNNNEIDRLSEISDVNIFVGANNSGKSRFSRGLLKMQEYVLFSNDFENQMGELTNGLSSIFNKISDQAYINITLNRSLQYDTLKTEVGLIRANNKISNETIRFNRNYIENILSKISEFLTNLTKENREYYFQEFKSFLGVLKIITRISQNYRYVDARRSYEGINVNLNFSYTLSEKISPILSYCTANLDYIIANFIQVIKPKKIFIPTQRGAKTLIRSNGSFLESDLYKATIVKTYFKDVEGVNVEGLYENLSIFTGLDLYDQVKKVRNSKRKVRKSFEKFEIFLKKYFFNNKEVDIVALDGDKHLSFYLDDEDLEIHDLGDGIQAIIVLMFPVFTAENDSWIFIDEPELNLHPGMQRLFLKQILSNSEIKKKNLKFFITTHSNHLLDLTLDHDNISIYSFSKLIGKTSKDHKFLIRNVKSGDSSLMEDLGVNSSSVFLANCSIWVEGITDRKYLSAFLRAYLESNDKTHYFKEDADFTFFEYAGSNLAHYYFTEEVSDEQKEEIKDQINAFSLANRIYLLADKDGDDKKLKHDFLKKSTRDNENIVYRDTGAIEIENILSFSIIQKALVDVFGQDEALIGNIDNIDEKDYAQERLGQFLNRRVNNRKGIDLPKISDNNKTLNSRYKLKLANYVYDSVIDGKITWDMISENRYAKKITLEVFNFIDKYKDKV